MEDGVWVWVIVEAIGGEFWGGGVDVHWEDVC